MAKYHTEREIFKFMTGDFECAWNALAERPQRIARNRGNFMFALQAAVLLEWVGRFCDSDATGKARNDFAVELNKIEPKYFTELDSRCRNLGSFTFPGINPDPLKSLLCAIWDLIRNGQAHLYHDIIVELIDGKKWVLGIGGVNYRQSLSKIAARRPPRHLTYHKDSDGDLMLKVHPGVLFLDICSAVDSAQLLSRGLTIDYSTFTRGGSGKKTRFTQGEPRKKTYQFDLNQLELALKRGGLEYNPK